MKNIFIIITCCMLAFVSRAQLVLTPGVSLTSTAGSYIVMDNIGMKHDCTPQQFNCTFKFTGSSDAGLGGSTIPQFSDIELNNSNGASLTLLDEIACKGKLTFISGMVNLHGSILNLGSTGKLINENETNRLIEFGQTGGYAVSSYPINAPDEVNPGNLGAEISTSADLGLVTVKRSPQPKSGVGLAGSILRNFTITTANATNPNTKLTLYYFDAELNGLYEDNLDEYNSVNGLSYGDLGFSFRNNAANFIKQTNLSALQGIYTLGAGRTVPVLLTDFNAVCKNGAILLSWKTITEENTDRFDVQRSSDGISWQTIGSVKAAGVSAAILSYQFTDANMNTPVAYYRLSQHDLDNKITNSVAIKTASCGRQTGITVMPNPVKSIAKVRISSGSKATGLLQLYNVTGQLTWKREVQITAGENLFDLDMSAMPAGTYMLRYSSDNADIQTLKLIKQ